ncbi:MAG: ribonuclease III domain-containing protein [Synechocystis sp.]|nr:ribonuclease III domain-containing protein [Synechocystis sp.]
MTQFHAHPLWQSLTNIPFPHSPQSLSPTALAYLGDAVFELYVRCRYLFPPRRINDLHRLVVDQVRAEQQAQLLDGLMPQLTAAEKEWVRRGRNAAASNRRASANVYQAASGLETLLGYLYLTDPQRLDKLLVLAFPTD